ncbi:MAG: Stp1/IreP family PP2C-type Ser/Thr phosphatase, partial [Prosthecobacter sp.]|nr:Stp1/IreP family PP2C-type Ser/Thr phosphatase [Prosthecobacter sp.]
MTVEAAGSEQNILSSISYACGTDIGRCREENQDSYGVIENARCRVFMVADGMGGVKGGKLASSVAVDVITTALSGNDVSDAAIRAAIMAANTEVFEKGREDHALTGMGTTITGVAFTGLRMYLFNIGDSRVYRVRGERISQLSEDHTLVKELVDNGTITPGQAHNHPVSHMLTRSLGPTPDVQIDCGICDDGPAAGDMYLMCSDGLYNLVSEREILEILVRNDLQSAVNACIALANQRGGTDNITVIAVQVGDDFPVGADEYPEDDRAIGLDDTVELYMDEALEDEIEDAGETLDTAEVSDRSEEEPVELEPQTRGIPVDGGSPVIEQHVSLNERTARVQQREEPEEVLDDEPKADPGEVLEEVEAPPVEALRAAAPERAGVRPYVGQVSMTTGLIVLALVAGVGLGKYFTSEAPPAPVAQQIPQAASGEAGAVAAQREARAPLPVNLEIAHVAFDRDAGLVAERAAMIAPRPNAMQAEDPYGLMLDGAGQPISSLDSHELDTINSRRLELETMVAKLRDQVAAFDKPLSGKLAEDIRQSARARDSVRARLEGVQMNMDATAR